MRVADEDGRGPRTSGRRADSTVRRRLLDRDGDPFGVTSTVPVAPLASSNGVSDLRLGVACANAGPGADCVLAPGTESFVGHP